MEFLATADAIFDSSEVSDPQPGMLVSPLRTALLPAHRHVLAFVYRTAAANQSSAFFRTQGDGSLPHDQFFSFTTLTTTDYGNLVPAGNPGQTFAVAEMLVGSRFW